VAGSLVNSCDPLFGAVADAQCDGLDNDCDGAPDDEYVATATACGLGECTGNAGLLECVAGTPVDSCDPLFGAAPDAQCDGLDNDCDGAPDDEYVAIATACGVGECTGNIGLLECVAGAPVDTCDPLFGAAPDAQCDGLDNDCDGAPDDEYVATATACGVGECTGNAGLLECITGTPTDSCDPLFGAAPDAQCDGLDNDCDGAPDDEYIATATACGVGECTGNAGLLECISGTTVDRCDPFAGAALDDQCDGLDNDCDVAIDEDGQPIITGTDTGECTAGIQTCIEGIYQITQTEILPSAEICDSLDNDCNVAIDDDIDLIITGSDAGECRTEIQACVGGTFQITQTEIPPSVEICDSRDNDCNVTIDDNIDLIISGSNTGECRTEVQACVGGTFQVTQTEIPPSTEICDGFDNDCNTIVDNGFGPISCGIGVCENIVNSCVAGARQVCEPLPGAGQEFCQDGLDDDCDGFVDDTNVCDLEGFDAPVLDLELTQIFGQDLVLAAAQTGGLRLLEFSSLGAQQVGSFDPGKCKDGVADVTAAVEDVDAESTGEFAYLAAGACGFFVASIADSVVSPTWIAAIDTPGYGVDVELVDEKLLLYVADNNGGIRIYDVVQPATPQLLANVGSANPNFGAAIDVDVLDDIAYVATTRGLRILDSLDPQNPVLIGTFDPNPNNPGSGPGQDVEVVTVGDLVIAYLSAFQHGVFILDVKDPTDPQLIAQIPSTVPGVTPIYEVTVAGQRAFLSEGSATLRIYDVSDPSDPLELAPFDARGDARDVAVKDGVAYLGLGEDSFSETPGAEAVHVTVMGLEVEDVSPIPEPGGAQLAAAVLATLTWLRWRRRGRP
jgi:hypothetical protein